MIAYRDATLADAATLVALARSTFTETFGHLYRPDDLAVFLAGHDLAGWSAELADPRFAVRLVEAGGQAVGYAKLGPPGLPFTPRERAIELRQIYVAASHQGHRIGSALIDWSLAEARRRDAAEIHLSVFTQNHGARRLYERVGFERIGAYAFMVGAQADEDDVMRLML